MGKPKQKPEAIMINVPREFFKRYTVKQFMKYYESMGQEGLESACFYHFISSIPVSQDLSDIYICFLGRVVYKAKIVTFLKNESVTYDSGQVVGPRNWVVTTGPVVKPPKKISQEGFRGFRYCNQLF